ncbi:MAG TPA: hypothetical protein VJP45_04485 [Candidatus Limnocylindria bacterium]|nr:hypothetical protein [Candidatus Limnocylindria bacterium]
MAAVIRFVCRAPAHQRQAATRTPSSPITYHADSWAYCAFGASEDHKWEAIAAASLEDVRKRINGEDRRRAVERS